MKFNRKMNLAERITNALRNRSDATQNMEGGLAFQPDAKAELYQRVLTCLLGEQKFYESPDATAEAIIELSREVAATDPEWILKLAAYSRQEMNLRTVAVFLLVLAAELPACKPFVRRWVPAVLRRAHEPAEAISAWTARHGSIGSQGPQGGDHAFPNSLKKGIADALARFDEYQLEKYNRDGSVKVRDVLRVCRPNPGQRQALYKYLRWDWDRLSEDEKAELPRIAALRELARIPQFGPESLRLAATAHATWEVLISQYGNRAEVWDALDLPFMAGLRNLRNLLQSGSTRTLTRVLEQLQDQEAVRRSKQFPFRFLSAYRELQAVQSPQTGAALAALSRAAQLSVANLPKFPGTTVVAADNSGSVTYARISKRGSVTCADVANVFAALAGHLSEAGYTMAFGSDAVAVQVNPADSILTNAERVAKADTHGMATNGYLVPAHLRGIRVQWSGLQGTLHNTAKPVRADRVVIFTDCQLYNTLFGGHSLAQQMALYRQEVNPQARLYVFNLIGYGTAQVPKDDPLSVQVAGWSEQVLRFIPLFEQGAAAGVSEIDRMTPDGVASPLESE